MKKDSKKEQEFKIDKEEKISKFKSVIFSPGVMYTVGAIVLIVLAFIVQYFVNRPNFGTFLSSDMDLSNNVYILGVDEEKDAYKVTKVLPSGATKFQIDLEKSTKDSSLVYRNLEVDSKGNFYFVKQKKDLKAIVSDKSMYPTLNETVLMYDSNGNYIKQLASIDFSKDATPPTDPYIRKIQIVDQNITLIACEDNRYDIITANPLLDESPKKIKSFEISPNVAVTSQKYKWVSDMSVLSTGRIFYSTLNGELYATNNQGEFENYSNVLTSSPFIVTGMSVDSSDDIYFTDSVNGKFYKLNTKSSTLQNLYSLDSSLGDGLSVKMKDVRSIKSLGAGDFYAASKAFDKPFHVRFGSYNYLVGDLRGSLFPWGYVIMISVILVVIGLFYAIRYLAQVEIKRIPLSVKILGLFLPVFVVAMGILAWVNTSDGVNEYMSVLRAEQERSAKTAADAISGSDFAKLDHVSGYMNADYVKLKNALQKGYNDVSLKIGDRSDYIVTYVESYGKLYNTLSTRYDVNSESYDTLKYTDPDMVAQRYTLVDCILEQDEVQKIYNVWNQFSNKANSSDAINVMFRDVYGDLSASFVAVKDTNGRVVGLVGNFLDEGVHSQREFWEILKHTSALILVITVLIGVFITFIIKWSFRPLGKIEKAIDTMSKGEWHTRVRVSSKDELADIAQAFNLMSEKIGRYTSNLIKLNKEYIRYVPKEIFKLIGKEKITQVDLYDHKILNLNVIYLSFNISCKECFDFKDENEVFEAVNASYNKLFSVVEENKGIVQSFDGLKALIVFPESAQDAFNASLQFKEVEMDESIKNRMHIILSSGDVLVGVSGDENRRGVIVVSDEIMQMFNIDSRLSILGINHIATSSIIDNVKESKVFSYRYIGRAGKSTDDGFTDIYQIIEEGNQYKKDLYISTEKTFSEAINLYLQGKFVDARKLFTDVLRINENDKVSIKYLMLCEKEIAKLKQIPESKEKFTGYLI